MNGGAEFISYLSLSVLPKTCSRDIATIFPAGTSVIIINILICAFMHKKY